MEKIAKLKGIVSSMETDAIKFYERGNHAAGRRVRKSMQEVKTLAQQIRQDVTAKKKKQ